MPARITLTHNTTRYVLMHYAGLVQALQGAGWEVGCAAPADDAVPRLEAMGVRCTALPMSRRGMNPLRELGTMRRFHELFRRQRPDAAFNFSIKPVVYGSLAARAAGVPNVFSMITGTGYLFLARGWRARLARAVALPVYRMALAANRAVFFQNADDRDMISARLGLRSTRCVVLDGPGIDPEAFRPPREPAPPGTFVMVARLLSDKGVREYVEAARQLAERYPSARFRLVGPQDDNPAAIPPAEIEAWQREGVIDYVAEVDDVRPLLADSAVFVLPSYREGLPRATLEAMSMGLPVVTTDVPGCRETVIEGENGHLVPARNAPALAAAMARLIGQPEAARRMGRASRRLVLERFAADRVNGRILEVLNGYLD